MRVRVCTQGCVWECKERERAAVSEEYEPYGIAHIFAHYMRPWTMDSSLHLPWHLYSGFLNLNTSEKDWSDS